MFATNGRRRVVRVATVVGAAVVYATLVSGCSSSHRTSSASGSVATKVTDQNVASVAGPTPATTPVAAPTPGNITSEVPSVVDETAAPVALSATADFGGGVTGKIVKLESINASARLPGEVAGPALRITFSVTNGSASTIDLRLVTVNVTNSVGTPAVPISGNGTNLFTGTLGAGKSAQGIYVLSLATQNRNPVTISVSYSSSAKVVLFTGNAN